MVFRKNFTQPKIKDVFLHSLKEAKEIGYLSVSQRQAIIKLLEKKDRYKKHIKNWRPNLMTQCRHKISFCRET